MVHNRYTYSAQLILDGNVRIELLFGESSNRGENLLPIVTNMVRSTSSLVIQTSSHICQQVNISKCIFLLKKRQLNAGDDAVLSCTPFY